MPLFTVMYHFLVNFLTYSLLFFAFTLFSNFHVSMTATIRLTVFRNGETDRRTTSGLKPIYLTQEAYDNLPFNGLKSLLHPMRLKNYLTRKNHYYIVKFETYSFQDLDMGIIQAFRYKKTKKIVLLRDEISYFRSLNSGHPCIWDTIYDNCY